jgi:uncharacterized protein YjbI with pentapeptide repeats
MSFEQKGYYQEKFQNLALSGEVFEDLTFEECQFISCHLIECKFQKCRFLNCSFAQCLLSAVVPLESRFSDVKFTGSKVIGLDWTKAFKVRDLEFVQSQINYSSFKFMALPKMKVIGCEAREADFTEADLSGADFSNTDLENSRFFKTNLSEANFKGARNYFIDTRTNNLKKARFSMPEVINLLNTLDIIIE